MKSTPNQLPLPHDNLITFCNGLQKKLREQVGHLHVEALEKYHSRGQIIPAGENDEFRGYLLFNDTPAAKLKRGIPTCVRIYHAAIQYDAQRIQHGTLLINQLIARARQRGFYRLDCFVTSTIPANEFWQSLGFDLVGTRPGGKKRKRTLNHYRLRLPARPNSQLPEIPRPTSVTPPSTSVELRRRSANQERPTSVIHPSTSVELRRRSANQERPTSVIHPSTSVELRRRSANQEPSTSVELRRRSANTARSLHSPARASGPHGFYVLA